MCDEPYVYRCECTARPHHTIPGMTTKLYHELTLKWGVKYHIQSVDCNQPLLPGYVVVEQTDIYRVVGLEPKQ